jgi:hypothetical protein
MNYFFHNYEYTLCKLMSCFVHFSSNMRDYSLYKRLQNNSSIVNYLTIYIYIYIYIIVYVEYMADDGPGLAKSQTSKEPTMGLGRLGPKHKKENEPT